MNQEDSMYAVDDHDQQMLNSVTAVQSTTVNSQDLTPWIQKITVDGQSVMVASAQGITKINQTLQRLSTQLADLNNQHTRMHELLRTQQQQIAQLRSDLANKISYD